MEDTLRTVVVSDVSLGYGTPQILRLANSIASRYGGEVLILEPDQPERPAVKDLAIAPNVRVSRIVTSRHPYGAEGSIEFTLVASDLVGRFDPDIFVAAAALGMRVGANTNLRRETIKLFYCLEDAGYPLLDDGVVPRVAGLWDLVLFPEINRLHRYSSELQLRPNTRRELIYNANERRRVRPVSHRNGRIFYGGLIHKDLTVAGFFPHTPELPIDAFGKIDGYYSSETFTQDLVVPGGASYKGYLRADDSFFDTLSTYAFSLVGWMPLRFDFINAAPNKLFDAIACGVPPIAAPHPQCVEIIEKWKCGLLLEDWSLDTFKRTVSKAVSAIGSDYHRELVANCQRAMEHELSWDRQFEKVAPHIDRLLPRLGLPA